VSTKAELCALEKVFAAEIEGRLPFQSKAKIYDKLQERGMVDHAEQRFGSGMWRVTVRGWVLTHAGRYTYCKSCEGNE
jgi:hypothetical protein